MSRLLKIVATIMIAVGFCFVVLYYSLSQDISKSALFDRPSYYVDVDYKFLVTVGVAIIIIAVIASFVSWLRKMDVKEDELKNAGYVDSATVSTWVSGSSLDTGTFNPAPVGSASTSAYAGTMNNTPMAGETYQYANQSVQPNGVYEPTEVLANNQFSQTAGIYEPTEVLPQNNGNEGGGQNA